MSAVHNLFDSSHDPSLDETLSGAFDDGTDSNAIIVDLLEENQALRLNLERLLGILDAQHGPSDAEPESVVQLAAPVDRRDHDTRPFDVRHPSRDVPGAHDGVSSLNGRTRRVTPDDATSDGTTSDDTTGGGAAASHARTSQPPTREPAAASAPPLITREQLVDDLKRRFVFSEANLNRVRRLADRIERRL